MRGSRRCSVCGARLRRFTGFGTGYPDRWREYGFDHTAADFEMLNAAEYLCPVCGASDRDRVCAHYAGARIAADARPVRLIDFAPSPPLRRFLRSLPLVSYRCADLYMADVDDRVDLCDLACYADASFDCFLCSHVLEHVQDDRRAMRELHRILAPGGWGIVLTPISLRLAATREADGRELTEAERWRLFGQDDHVRLYSRRDFVQRLERADFRVRAIPAAGLDEDRCRAIGASPASVLYVVEKPVVA